MKKRLAFTLALAFVLCGCSKGAETSVADQTADTTVALTETTAEETTEADTTEEETTEADTTEAETEKTSSGSLTGRYAGDPQSRATLQIEQQDDGTYYCYIEWSSSASEVGMWDFSGAFDEENVLHYTDCAEWSATYDENGKPTYAEPTYENGTGTLTVDGEDLIWLDDTSENGEVRFVKFSDEIQMEGRGDTEVSGDIYFGTGVYAAQENRVDNMYYCFYDTESGKILDVDGETGIGFTCEQKDDQVIFHKGSAEESEVMEMETDEDGEIYGTIDGVRYHFIVVEGADPNTFDPAEQ